MDDDKLSKKQELNIFRKVNSSKNIIKTDHYNVIMSAEVNDAIKNQGVSRAKLRKFIIKEDLNYEYWKNL